MKKITNYLILFAVILISGQLLAQTTTNVEALNTMSEELQKAWKEKEVRVIEYSQIHNVPITFESTEGAYYEIIDVIDGVPQYYRTDNFGAAVTTRANELWEGGNSGLELTGEGYNQLGEWDGGNVRVSHQEFTDQGASRVTVMDGAHATHYHSTHVAGTMIAAGISSNAKGMAYGGLLKSWQWTSDESEMAAAAANGLEISNHSYGFVRGWDHNNGSWVWHGSTTINPDEDYKFGFYDSGARQWDQIAYNAPYYLIVKSAGNDRGDGPSNAGNGAPEVDGGEDGYDCISPRGIAKNLLTVGAVNEVSDYTGPESVVMSNFSCWGPADDGRIKPDIVGKGVGVYSAMDGSNTDYGTLQGTSMSAPNVSGSMALLQSYYQNTHNDEVMRASTLKGLVLHTADEAGEHDGPDYIFGWGLMNAERAAEVITDDINQVVIDELLLTTGDVFTRDVIVPEGRDLRVTICWTDPAGSPVAPELNPSDIMLVNDLDIKIEDSNSNTYFPYSLDRNNPSAAATTTAKNYVDNVELIYIQNASPGTYTITVDYDGTLSGGEQAFSIIISGIDEYISLPSCSADLTSPEEGSVNAFINQNVIWDVAQFATSYDVFFGTDGNGTATPTNIFNGNNFITNDFVTLLEPNTTYYLQVSPRNNIGANNECMEIWSFTTMEEIIQYPYLIDMENVNIPALPEDWQTTSFTDASWFSSGQAGNSGDNSMACYNTSGFVKAELNNWFISPPFSVETGYEYMISYYYKNLLPGTDESLTLFWGNTPMIDDLTNIISEQVDFSNINWEESRTLFVPDNDGAIYLGFQMNSTFGYGGFIDDVQVEHWGTVGIGDEVAVGDFNIYSNNGRIFIIADESWIGSDIVVTSMLGQNIYQGNLSNGTDVQIPINNQSGLYIVSLNNNGTLFTKKVFVR
ncbi:MAG: S8 family serine peptidase [Bacteroidota bacterium]